MSWRTCLDIFFQVIFHEGIPISICFPSVELSGFYNAFPVYLIHSLQDNSQGQKCEMGLSGTNCCLHGLYYTSIPWKAARLRSTGSLCYAQANDDEELVFLRKSRFLTCCFFCCWVLHAALFPSVGCVCPSIKLQCAIQPQQLLEQHLYRQTSSFKTSSSSSSSSHQFGFSSHSLHPRLNMV